MTEELDKHISECHNFYSIVDLSNIFLKYIYWCQIWIRIRFLREPFPQIPVDENLYRVLQISFVEVLVAVRLLKKMAFGKLHFSG